jgi:hypothetical protein
MRFLTNAIRSVALCSVLMALCWAQSARADEPKSQTKAAPEIPTVDLLKAMESGQVAV